MKTRKRMFHRRTDRTERQRPAHCRALPLVVSVAALGLTSTVAQGAGAAAPNDYLCYVEGSSQSAQVGTTFPVPLQVEVSSTSCSDPTPDTSTSNYVTYAVVTSANGPSVGFSPLASVLASNGEASVFATANYVAGSFSVVATSSTTTSNSASQSVVFDLTNTTLVPASISGGVAGYQEAPLGTAFALAFSATVEDSFGNPVPGVQVTFAAPASGASGTFAGTTSNEVTVVTDTSGVAVAPTFYANSTAGGYVVKASVSGLGQQAGFALVNEATTVESVSSVSPSRVAQGSSDVDLTVSGAGFANGATVAFSTPGVNVNSSSFESSTTLLANVSISRSAAAGLSTVTVTNPGGAGVTGGFLLSVTPLAVRPAGLSLQFSNRSDILNSNERTRLATFSKRLLSGASITISSYAPTRQVADSRIVSVSRFLRSRSHGLHIEEHQIISTRLNVVRVMST